MCSWPAAIVEYATEIRPHLMILLEKFALQYILTWPEPHLQNIMNQLTQVWMHWGISLSFSGMWNIYLAHNATLLTLFNSMSFMRDFHFPVLANRQEEGRHFYRRHAEIHQVQSKAINNTAKHKRTFCWRADTQYKSLMTNHQNGGKYKSIHQFHFLQNEWNIIFRERKKIMSNLDPKSV